MTSGNSSPYSLAGRGIDAAGAGAALAPTDDVGADDEVAIGVEALARTDHGLPPPGTVLSRVVARGVSVPGQSVQYEYGVALSFVEHAVGLVGDGDRSEGLTRVEGKRRELHRLEFYFSH